jgi:hypothetical protein
LSWNSYLLSKLSLLFLLSAIQTLSFVLIGNLILEIKGMTLAFWLVLFSTSCFANVLGLNISSAFNSAVTVYVMIPLLLIPQMILSGLLFSFDKLNNFISTKGKVPVVADLMASRWAYEAMAVHQFKNNGYEAPYFDFHMAESKADFKAGYIADELRKRNSFILENWGTANDSVKQTIQKNLTIIRQELLKEPFREGIKTMDIATTLQPQQYTKEAGEALQMYFDAYQKFYQKQYNESVAIAEKAMSYFEKNIEGYNVNEYKNSYYNESLADLVRNVSTKDRLMEYNGTLLQQINPVFQDPEPSSVLDYRTAFFVPKKNLFGTFVSTYIFDILVIWLMSIALYIVLYFEILKKLVNSFGNLNLSNTRKK